MSCSQTLAPTCTNECALVGEKALEWYIIGFKGLLVSALIRRSGVMLKASAWTGHI